MTGKIRLFFTVILILFIMGLTEILFSQQIHADNQSTEDAETDEPGEEAQTSQSYRTIFTFVDTSVDNLYIEVGIACEQQQTANELKQIAINEVKRYFNLLSADNQSSIIARWNRSLITENPPFSFETPDYPEITEALVFCENVSVSTGRNYNYIMRPLYELWNQAINTRTLPDASEVEQHQRLVGFGQNEYRNDYLRIDIPVLGVNFQYIYSDRKTIEINEDSITFYRNGMGIDLGNGLNGVLCDAAADKLIEEGLRIFQEENALENVDENQEQEDYQLNFSGYINVNGTVRFIGSRPTLRSQDIPWKVGVLNPRSVSIHTENSMNILDGYLLYIRNLSVSTSGDYFHYYIDSMGRRVHTVINPQSGYPANFNPEADTYDEVDIEEDIIEDISEDITEEEVITADTTDSDEIVGQSAETEDTNEITAVVSATVIGPQAAFCSMLSQAFIIMPIEESLDLIDSRENYEALFIVKRESGDYEFVLSSGFNRFLRI